MDIERTARLRLAVRSISIFSLATFQVHLLPFYRYKVESLFDAEKAREEGL